MDIIGQLASRKKDLNEFANEKVALQCIQSPDLLTKIVETLSSNDELLVGDCVEVLTKVAEEKPLHIVPHIEKLTLLFQHTSNRIRWEATHAVSLIAVFCKNEIAVLLPVINEMIKKDPSVVVRDHAMNIIANYAKCGSNEARNAFPILKESLFVWDGKHAAYALLGLVNVAKNYPESKFELTQIGNQFSNSGSAVANRAAATLLKGLQAPDTL